jgi:TolB-like protein/DNA-binding winged helix-turn-helix (wHTH) protein/thioredoxin-like negative regulator of GroEL
VVSVCHPSEDSALLEHKDSYLFGDAEIQADLSTITLNGVSNQVSPRVMDVLAYLIKHRNRVVTTAELLSTFWSGRIVEESSIHRLISQIRTALSDSVKEPKYIKTFSKRGYQAIAPVQLLPRIPTFSDAETAEFQPTRPVLAPAIEYQHPSDLLDINPQEQQLFAICSETDKEIVHQETHWLEQQGYRIEHGRGKSRSTDHSPSIDDSSLGPSIVLFFISERAIASEQDTLEIRQAVDAGVPVIPIFLDDTELTSDLRVCFSNSRSLRLKDQGFRDQLKQALIIKRREQPSVPAVKPIRLHAPRRLFAVVVAIAVLALVTMSIRTLNKPLSNAGLHENGEVIESIAVIPFTNLSDNTHVAYFADGLTDSILNELAQIGHLKVASRINTLQFYQQSIGFAELGKQLNVDYIMEGSVQEMNGVWRTIIQLIRVVDGFHIMSKTYDRPSSNSFSAQNEISTNISLISRHKIWHDLRQLYPSHFEALRGINAEAVNLYLQACDNYNDYVLGNGGDVTVALQLMERAAEIDPTFRAALSELAWNYMRRINPNYSISESSRLAHAAIQRMQALDSKNSDAAFRLAQVYVQLDLDYASAEKLIEQEIAKAPKSPWWRSLLAQIAAREGRANETFELMKTDATLHYDHTFPEFLPLYAKTLMRLERFDESLKYSDEALALIHHGPRRAQALLTKTDTLMRMDRWEEAKLLLKEAQRQAGGEIQEEFSYIFSRLGQPERARRALDIATKTHFNRLHFALGYESLGEIETVLELLFEGIEDHDRSIIDQMRLGTWSPAIKEHPRFLELLALLRSKEKPSTRFIRSTKNGVRIELSETTEKS